MRFLFIDFEDLDGFQLSEEKIKSLKGQNVFTIPGKDEWADLEKNNLKLAQDIAAQNILHTLKAQKSHLEGPLTRYLFVIVPMLLIIVSVIVCFLVIAAVA